MGEVYRARDTKLDREADRRGYRFTDFVKVGAPLNALLMVVTSVAIHLLWR